MTPSKNVWEAYRRSYGSQYSAIVRAPGRVNIIGEHTDYNGFPVLPIAIDRGITIAFEPTSEPVFEARNMNNCFSTRTFSIEEIAHQYPQGDWGNYLKAALRGLIDAGMISTIAMRGFRGMVHGTIPPSSGLSSSSALIVAFALCTLHANDARFDKRELAEILAKAEKYAGIEGGGMDQAISLLAEKDHALRIDFFPLRTKLVSIPPGWVFIVCDSLVQASKTESSRAAYNRRAVECRLATALLNKSMTAETGVKIEAERLSDLNHEQLGMTYDQYMTFGRLHLGSSSWSLYKIARSLGLDERETEERYCTVTDGSIFTQPEDGYMLFKRFKHVIDEAQRVDDAIKALESGDMKTLGSLMDASHASCRNLYCISSVELDELVIIGKSNGSYGSRLTGAGFGGCTIHLIQEEKSNTFISQVLNAFYTAKRIHAFEQSTGEEFRVDDAVFSCKPEMGAMIEKLDRRGLSSISSVVEGGG